LNANIEMKWEIFCAKKVKKGKTSLTSPAVGKREGAKTGQSYVRGE